MPSAEQLDQLKELLVVPAGGRRSALDRLRRGPTQPTAVGLEALRRLSDVRELGVSELDLSGVPAGRLWTRCSPICWLVWRVRRSGADYAPSVIWTSPRCFCATSVCRYSTWSILIRPCAARSSSNCRASVSNTPWQRLANSRARGNCRGSIYQADSDWILRPVAPLVGVTSIVAFPSASDTSSMRSPDSSSSRAYGGETDWKVQARSSRPDERCIAAASSARRMPAGHKQQRDEAAGIRLGSVIPHGVSSGRMLRAAGGPTPARARRRVLVAARGQAPPAQQLTRPGRRGDDLGHHAQVRREWPGVGHGAEDDVDVLCAGELERIRVNDVDQGDFGHIQLHRPIAVRQLPTVLPCGARAGQDPAGILEDR
jgi:hypothetical protein